MIAVVLCVVSAGAYATGALLQQWLADRPMRLLPRTLLWDTVVPAPPQGRPRPHEAAGVLAGAAVSGR